MKKIGKILLIITFFFLFASNVSAKDKNLVNLYFFHSDGCPHCSSEDKLLKELEEQYDNLKVYRYEIHDDDNSKIFTEVADILNVKVTGTPFTVIGETSYSGFSDSNSKETFIKTIEYYSKYGYDDEVGTYLEVELPTYEKEKDQPSLTEYMDDYGNYIIDIPFIGSIETKNFALPIVTIIIALVDGFNPCAMWVLLFLISMLIGVKDKKRMWLLGISFLLASALTYLILMLAWLNVTNLLISVIWFRLFIALLALSGGLLNVISYFRHKENGCNVVDDKKRKKLFVKIKKFTTEKNIWLALCGVVIVAISVNIIELACSAGLPVMFTSILAMNDLSIIEFISYIALYILFFLIDDIIVFIIAMKTLELTGISTKFGKTTKLVGGIILLLMGLLLVFKPEWIMLNF